MISQQTDVLTLAANRLSSAESSRTPCAPLSDILPAQDVDLAYQVQNINTQRRLTAGHALVGRKIGLTSKAVQAQLGVDQPDYGMLFDDMAVPDGWEIASGRLLQPKAEAEIAFVLGRDLGSEHITLADIIGAVEYALPAIEVVDSRIANWKISIVDTVADNASSGLYVLGGHPRRLSDLNLRDCAMVMTRQGQPVSTGVGAACLGNPLNALWWLAQMMVRVGRPLQAGDTVLSGALGPMVSATPGDVLEASITGLGSVRAAFAKES
ncbi:2-keto-4-pentenoate hydratase [Insolitispirillum peregrinum]|uniref:2-keto-4-pentenoate hydratase n=1 Tax=Insolitispirillum peregrinum TaxID=80876 RepID=A0A1N7NBX8_9PROT|nr:fumarylacetoacetate hydrolase family protein [Insolitispirillum peregrinum]SIS95867.1 2-keto-4-pentenoate hydratase [Insolitispirillum peregrinum]